MSQPSATHVPFSWNDTQLLGHLSATLYTVPCHRAMRIHAPLSLPDDHTKVTWCATHCTQRRGWKEFVHWLHVQMCLPVLYKYWPLPTCMFSSLIIISLLLVTSVLFNKLSKNSLLFQARTSAPIMPQSLSLTSSCQPSADCNSSISSLSNLLVTPQKSSFHALKHLSNNQCIHSTWSQL